MATAAISVHKSQTTLWSGSTTYSRTRPACGSKRLTRRSDTASVVSRISSISFPSFPNSVLTDIKPLRAQQVPKVSKQGWPSDLTTTPSCGSATAWQKRTTALPEIVYLDDEGDLPVLPLAINNRRMPHYFSVYARISRTWRWSHESLELFAELINVTDRRNTGAIGYELESDDEAGSALLVREKDPLIPFIPSVGVTFTF